jgi:hypothetical protein
MLRVGSSLNSLRICCRAGVSSMTFDQLEGLKLIPGYNFFSFIPQINIWRPNLQQI